MMRRSRQNVAMANKWVNEVWWRDWLFWVGAIVATGNLIAGIAADDSEPWWWLAWRWGFSFVVVVAIFGFVRLIVRTYREPTPTEE